MSRGVAVSLVAIAALLLASCATGPPVGVRSDYRSSTLRGASIVPFFSRSAYGLDRTRLDERLGWAEAATVEWLDERGVRLETPASTRRRLRAASQWSHFTAEGIFVRNLAESFESAPRRQRRETQVEILTSLDREGTWSQPYVLFGELLYQTSGTCRSRADRFTKRAEVVVAPGADDSMPRPCIVSHFQARLIDPSTGATVWYNRRLRELHPPRLTESWIRRNIRAVVRTTLGGNGGVAKMLPDEKS